MNSHGQTYMYILLIEFCVCVCVCVCVLCVVRVRVRVRVCVCVCMRVCMHVCDVSVYSNAGGSAITSYALQQWKDGTRREDIQLAEVERILAKAAINSESESKSDSLRMLVIPGDLLHFGCLCLLVVCPPCCRWAAQ